MTILGCPLGGRNVVGSEARVQQRLWVVVQSMTMLLLLLLLMLLACCCCCCCFSPAGLWATRWRVSMCQMRSFENLSAVAKRLFAFSSSKRSRSAALDSDRLPASLSAPALQGGGGGGVAVGKCRLLDFMISFWLSLVVDAITFSSSLPSR